MHQQQRLVKEIHLLSSFGADGRPTQEWAQHHTTTAKEPALIACNVLSDFGDLC
jgi:hypothetical protein